MVAEDPVETLWKRSGVLKLAVSIGVSERAQKITPNYSGFNRLYIGIDRLN